MLFLVFFVKGKTAAVQNWSILLTLISWGLLFGLRAYDVGNDTDMYFRFYTGQDVLGLGTYKFSSETTEYGFTFIANILHRISDDPTFFFLFSAVAAFLSVYQFYKDKENGMWGLLCFFIMSASFASFIIAMRQSISITIIFFGLYFILKSGWLLRKSNKNEPSEHKIQKKYLYIGLILCILSISIHRTTIILLPLLLLCNYIKWNKKVAIAVISLVFVLSISFSSVAGDVFDIALSFVGGLSEDNVNLLAERYKGNFGSSSMTLLKVSSWCMPLLVTVLNSQESTLKSFQFSCLMMGFVLYILFGSATMCIRMSMMFQIIGFSVFIPEAVSKNTNLRLLYLSFTVLYFYSAYQNYVRWIASFDDSTLPFYFIWE